MWGDGAGLCEIHRTATLPKANARRELWRCFMIPNLARYTHIFIWCSILTTTRRPPTTNKRGATTRIAKTNPEIHYFFRTDKLVSSSQGSTAVPLNAPHPTSPVFYKIIFCGTPGIDIPPPVFIPYFVNTGVACDVVQDRTKGPAKFTYRGY